MKNFTIDEYFDMLISVMKSNPTYADDRTKWHPEDMHYAVSIVSETIMNTLDYLNKSGLLNKKEQK